MSISPRQIHLDFHTSDLIPQIGKQFDPEQFAQTLKDAEVTSVTCFARCHHGMLYYPSKIHSAAIHPHLQRDLLGEQLRICRTQGIKAPVYLPIQWDQYCSERHPEWCMRAKTGQDIVASWSTPGYFEDGFYTFLCVNSPYREYVFEEVAELQQTYDIDGFFFDIVYPRACYCIHCVQKMVQSGVDLEDEKQVLAFSVRSLNRFKQALSQQVWQRNSRATVYYNTSHIHPGYRAFLDHISHVEVESLPSGGWGYDHFPVVGRYARTLGKPVVGMTAKFHTYWGDFHSLKNQEALEYECFLANAMGAKVSVGDQMHPDGQLSEAGYQLIGNVFRQLKAVEEYSDQSEAVCEIAILNPEENQHDADLKKGDALIGATRLLQEMAFQFDIIDSHADFSKYHLLILIDNYRLTEKVAGKINDYLQQGGRLLAAGAAPFKVNLNENWINNFPVMPQGDVPFSPDYIKVREPLLTQLPREELVMYQGSINTQLNRPDATVLADSIAPYFNRKGRAFCSHQHTPSSRESIHPALVSTAHIRYFAHPVFSIYATKAPRWVRTLVAEQCLALLDHQPLVSHNSPHSLIVLLNHQPEQKRYLLHLLHYVPENKCRDLLIVDSKPPLYDLSITVGLGQIQQVKLIRAGALKECLLNVDHVQLMLDKLDGYQIVSLSYAD